MATFEIVVRQFVSQEQYKSITRAPKLCYDTQGDAELDGKYSFDGASLADESCQTTTVSVPVVSSSLAQLVHSERRPIQQLRGGASIESNNNSGGTTTTTTTTTATISDCKITTSQVYGPQAVTRIRQVSPSKAAPKAKWNSTVKCSWPPSSPPRLSGGGGPVVAGGGGDGGGHRRPATTSTSDGGRMRTVGVMTCQTINAAELIKKVEALEFELDVHVENERQLLTVNEKLRKRLEMCLRELNDAGMMNLQLDNLNDEMEKILVLLRHLSERNAALEKEKALVLAKLEKEAALNKYAAATKVLVERQMDDHFVDLCDAECQTICSCQHDTRKRRRERKRWLEEETPSSQQLKSRSLSPTQFRRADSSPQRECVYS